MLDFQIVCEKWKNVDADCIVLPVNPDLTPAFQSEAAVFENVVCEEPGDNIPDWGSVHAEITACTGLRAKKLYKIVYPETENACRFGRKKHYESGIYIAQRWHNTIAIPLLFDSNCPDALEIAVRSIYDLKYIHDKLPLENRVLLVVPDEIALQVGQRILLALENAEAWPLPERTLLASINQAKLHKCIGVLRDLEALEAYRKYQWGSGGTVRDFYYPQKLSDVFTIMEDDYEYRKNMKVIRQSNLLPTDLSVRQVQTCLTWLKKDEASLISRIANDGTLLKLLLRLEDLLIKKYPWQ